MMFEDIESDEDNGRFQERPSSGSCFEKSGSALAGDGGDAEGVGKSCSAKSNKSVA